ncbi:corytuberine synthase-like [Nymphaea colorata]|uniref:corytuberine synthase-like n=1 Tax=Nymphaea colorata TaxID=210225 RepID=UPI00129D3105|nr:corytuberine synthase-like [Nymphaea colorata]
MAKFTKQPKIVAKLRKELFDALSSTDTKVLDMEQKLKELPYFQSCIKETLRLHPVVPILPYRATDTCEGLGHRIPKGSQVWVTVQQIVQRTPNGQLPDWYLTPNQLKQQRKHQRGARSR